MDKVLGCVGLLTLTVITTAFGLFTWGVTVMLLWNWFYPPIFHLPTITLLQAMGLMLLPGLVTHQEVDLDSSANAIGSRLLDLYIILPAVTLLLGFIIHLFF